MNLFLTVINRPLLDAYAYLAVFTNQLILLIYFCCSSNKIDLFDYLIRRSFKVYDEKTAMSYC